MGVPVYGPLNALCVCVCMSMCVFVCERDIKSELSYTCTNDHLYKTATCLRQSVLSPSKQSHKIVTVQDDHLSNATSNHLFCPPNEKKLSKQPLQNFTQQRNGKQT